MTILRKTLAVAAAAGLGMAGFAAQAHAAPAPTSPATSGSGRPAADVKALPAPQPGQWYEALTGTSIIPSTITPTAGAKYTIAGMVYGVGNQGKGSGTLTFNPSPANGAISCVAAADWAQVSAGKISWSNVSYPDPAMPSKGKFLINCTYNRDYSGIVNENLVLTAPGHTITDDKGTLGDSFSLPYTIGGILPTASASAKPTATSSSKPATAPTAPKASTGGLAKTGF